MFPAKQQTLTYDLDGNLTADGVWTYDWDAENRLAAMTMANIANVPNSKRLRLEFAYDAQNRRISKTVKSWNGAIFANPVIELFVYDGWNLLAILASDTSLLSSYTWGSDLSGSMAGAGGVGGLILASFYGSTTTNAFATYDGNGNVIGLFNATDATMAARYEFSPYGEMVRATGPLANVHPIRFSTKYADEETGLVYYGMRYYCPHLGEWLGRDPTTDQVFVNLYNFCGNSPLIAIDRDGRDFSLTGMLCAGFIGGVLGGLQNYYFLHGSFWKGFFAGFAGGAVSFGLGTSLANAGYSAAWGAALGAGTEQALKEALGGEKMNTGKIGMAMLIGGGLQLTLGNAMEEGVEKVLGSRFGTIPGTLSEKLSAVGLDGDTIALDASLAVAGNLGMAAAEGTWSMFETTIPNVGKSLAKPNDDATQ